jgi:RNA polymerase sigma-70 factor, ECF subfamily
MRSGLLLAGHRSLRCARVTTTDDELVDALRAGDERAFADLIDRYSPAMLAVARTHVATREIAEDVVQDTWLALLKGIDGFEGRSTLRTWLFRVLVNIAKTRGVREKRTTPVDLHADDGRPTVSSERFQSDRDQWPGHWVRFPATWYESPERSLQAVEVFDLVRRELARLPEQQRLVVSLRDVDGYEASEVCTLLGVTAANQRVLLHRGRVRIREALAGYFESAP